MANAASLGNHQRISISLAASSPSWSLRTTEPFGLARMLQEAGLPAALRSYCEEFSKVRGIPVSCETDESVGELSPGAALCLYRIAQEALGNVAKHSKATQVEVRLSRSDGQVCLSVSDNGAGFAASEKSGGLGLINMRERAHQLNGTFALDSERGHGTRVRVTVPFRPAS